MEPLCGGMSGDFIRIMTNAEGNPYRDYLDRLATESYDIANIHGWMLDPEKDFPQMCALLHSEISEAFEAYREHDFDSWVAPDGKPEGVASELADLFIRLLHYCKVLDIDLDTEYHRKTGYNRIRPYRHGGKRA